MIRDRVMRVVCDAVVAARHNANGSGDQICQRSASLMQDTGDELWRRSCRGKW